MKRRIIISIFFIFLFPLLAQSNNNRSTKCGTFNIHVDNDFFLFSFLDRYYTNGVKLTWISPDIKDYKAKSSISWLPFVNKPGFKHSFSLSIGHNIYTPSDISLSQLLVDDHPYAGKLFFEIGIHSRNIDRLDSFQINLGIIGPAALGKEIQTILHKLLSVTHPEGWQHQIKNEPIFQIYFERKWRALKDNSSDKIGFDLIPHLGGGLGNVYTYANAGLQLRFGKRLPDDFGIPLIRPGGDSNIIFFKQNSSSGGKNSFGFYGFFLLGGQIVLRNIFLDGNTFRNSHRVDKNPFLADLIAGIGMNFGRFNITCAGVFLTKQFKTQIKNHSFVSINISFFH